MLQHPGSKVISVEEWSNFTCTIDCNQNYCLHWRLAVPKIGLLDKPYIRSEHFAKFHENNNVTVESLSKIHASCTVPGGVMTETIRILGSDRVDGTVIQCAAINTRGGRDFFSKFATLRVK